MIHVVRKKVHYKKIPLKSVQEVLFLTKKTEKILPKIKIPVLVMQSSTDANLNKDNAKYLYEHLSSKNKKLVFIPDSYHVFISDRNKNMAFKEIDKFLKPI